MSGAALVAIMTSGCRCQEAALRLAVTRRENTSDLQAGAARLLLAVAGGVKLDLNARLRDRTLTATTGTAL